MSKASDCKKCGDLHKADEPCRKGKSYSQMKKFEHKPKEKTERTYANMKKAEAAPAEEPKMSSLEKAQKIVAARKK